jgi:hypothetical protein
MTRNKRLLYVLVMFGLVFFAVYILFFSKTELTLKNRNVRDNPAKAITLKAGNYLVGHDIKPGYYDITCLSGKVSLDDDVRMSSGDKWINYAVMDGTTLTIEGHGNLRFSPAAFQPVHEIGDHQYAIKHSANYIAGKDLPAGDYRFVAKGLNGSESIELTLFSSIHADHNSATYNLTADNTERNIHLEKGNLLSIVKHKQNEKDNILLLLTLQR